MNMKQFGGVVALSFFLVACGERQDARLENGQASSEGPAVSHTGEAYSAAGQVTATTGDRVTISHGAVPAAGWPAMTMTFTAERAELLTGLSQGDRVEFAFRKKGGGAVVTSISKR